VPLRSRVVWRLASCGDQFAVGRIQAVARRYQLLAPDEHFLLKPDHLGAQVGKHGIARAHGVGVEDQHQ
jgi:hypothetical protein